MLSCSPEKKEKIPISFAMGILEIIKKHGCKSVLFSGGEVFCYYDELISLAKRCSELGIDLELETNGFWGKSEKTVNDILSPIFSLPNRKIIYLSLDYYHLEYMELTNILRIASYCKQHGVPCEVNITPYTAEFDQKLIAILEKNEVFWISEKLIDVGRAKTISIPDKISILPFDQTDDYAFTIMPDGNCFARCDISYEFESYKEEYGFLGNAYDLNEFERIYSKFRNEFNY